MSLISACTKKPDHSITACQYASDLRTVTLRQNSKSPSGYLQDELQLNEWLTSSKALSRHLLQVMKEEDAQQSGTVSLAKLITRLQWLSQASIGLNNVMLACVIAHACSSADDCVKYGVWAPGAAAMLYSMLDPATGSVRLAAVQELKGRGEADRNRSTNQQTLQVGLLPKECYDW